MSSEIRCIYLVACVSPLINISKITMDRLAEGAMSNILKKMWYLFKGKYHIFK